MFYLVLTLFTSIFVPAKAQVCQICDQTITGRNFRYSAALDIIQEEIYLEEADFDDIRRHRYKRHRNKLKNHTLQVILYIL